MVNLFGIAFIFAVGSFVGWAVEFIYRSVTYRKMFNPGPLAGPYLLMWGFSSVFFYFVSLMNIHLAVKIILFGFSTTLLELVSGWFLHRFYNIRLWDYTNVWLNYKGYIAPKFSAVWTIMGVLFYFFVFPVITKWLLFVQNNIFLHFVLGLFYGIFFVDLFITYSITRKIKFMINEIGGINMQKITVNYVFFKNSIGEHIKQVKQNAFSKFFFQPQLRTKELFSQLKDFILKKR